MLYYFQWEIKNVDMMGSDHYQDNQYGLVIYILWPIQMKPWLFQYLIVYHYYLDECLCHNLVTQIEWFPEGNQLLYPLHPNDYYSTLKSPHITAGKGG